MNKIAYLEQRYSVTIGFCNGSSEWVACRYNKDNEIEELAWSLRETGIYDGLDELEEQLKILPIPWYEVEKEIHDR